MKLHMTTIPMLGSIRSRFSYVEVVTTPYCTSHKEWVQIIDRDHKWLKIQKNLWDVTVKALICSILTSFVWYLCTIIQIQCDGDVSKQWTDMRVKNSFIYRQIHGFCFLCNKCVIKQKYLTTLIMLTCRYYAFVFAYHNINTVK